MGNATAKQSNNRSTESQISPESPAPISAPSFSSGELGQLQEILYGAQQRSTHEMIATLQTQVNEQITTLGNMLNSRINQLTDSVEQINVRHEQKLADLDKSLKDESRSLSDVFKNKTTEIEERIVLLGKSSGEQSAKTHEEIQSLQAQLQSQLKDSHSALTQKIDGSVDQLQSDKLDKVNLARMLSEVSERLSSADEAASR